MKDLYGQIPISSMPINLVLLPASGEVVFVVVSQFDTVFDQSTDTIDAYFDMEGFSIGDSSYAYNTPYAYKELPDMLAWLQRQRVLVSELTIYKGI